MLRVLLVILTCAAPMHYVTVQTKALTLANSLYTPLRPMICQRLPSPLKLLAAAENYVF